MEFTGERIIPDVDDLNYMFIRHVVVYEHVANKIDAKDIILDLGCGEGYGSNLLSTRASFILGTDYDYDTLHHAKGKYAKNNLLFIQSSGNLQPFKDNAFDVICSLQVIEHIEEDQSYLSEIARTINDKGVVFISTPNKLTFSPDSVVGNPFHIREYRPGELSDLLSQFFAEVVIYGLSIKSDSRIISEIEQQRQKKIATIASQDTSLRKIYRALVPGAIRAFLWRKRMADLTAIDPDVMMNRINREDFLISENNLDEALDLIAVCRP